MAAGCKQDWYSAQTLGSVCRASSAGTSWIAACAGTWGFGLQTVEAHVSVRAVGGVVRSKSATLGMGRRKGRLHVPESPACVPDKLYARPALRTAGDSARDAQATRGAGWIDDIECA